MLNRKNAILFLLLCFGDLAHAAVNEIIPGDYEAPNVGIKLVTLYLAERKMDGPYVGGNRLTDDKATSLITALKLTTTVDVGGYTFCPMVALPYSNTKSDGATMSAIIGEKSVGYSDVMVGTTGWLINNKQKSQYIAATLLFFAPTGKYNSTQLLNIGENHYKSTLNIGYIQKLSDSFIVELSPEIAVYGKNSDSVGRGVKQQPSYAITTNLRYNLTPQITPYVGFQQNYGGKTVADGVRQDDALKTKKMSLGAYYYTAGQTQIFLRYAKEFDTQSGMRATDDILLRLQWWFM